MIELDEWQKEILNAKGNIILASGRQVGKSTIISMRDAEYAATNPKKSVLIISATERQAEELFIKVLTYLTDNYRHLIKSGKERPTKHVIRLKNGSIIRCLPTGVAGVGIRGFTIDRLTADEAAFIPEQVWTAVTPMLLTTGGDIVLLSTPHGKQNNYFYDRYKNADNTFKVFHVNSEEVIKNRKISKNWTELQSVKALEHLEREKRKMTKLQYAQEYLGEFVDDLRQFFSNKLIENCCIMKRREQFVPARYYLGMDIAGMGEDESTFEIMDKIDNENFVQVENIVTTKTYTTETSQKAIELMKIYKFRRIGVDDNGAGFGVFSELLRDENTRQRVQSLNNARRALDRDETKFKRLLKEDMYFNLLALMEKGKIKLLDDDELILSLKSIQYEYVTKENEATRLKIFGVYSHITEGLIRAAWLCYQDKSLNIWAR